MNTSVNDFVLAKFILQFLCDKRNVTYHNIELSFNKEEDNKLYIGKTKNVFHTVFCIVSKYINCSQKILGREFFVDEIQKQNFLTSLSINLQEIMKNKESFYSSLGSPIRQTLYRYSLIWIIMKDIICPMFQIPLKNIDVIVDNMPNIDFCKFYDKLDKKNNSDISSCIVINDINNPILLNACLFISVLNSYDLDPSSVIKSVLESSMRDKFLGLLKISLENDCKVKSFMLFLIMFCGLKYKDVPNNDKFYNFIKEAQLQPYDTTGHGTGQFWFLGLIEGLLEGYRGNDWSITKALGPKIDVFWNKVKKIEKERKGNVLPLSSLLFLKNEDYDLNNKDCTKTIQSLLEDERIW